MLLRRRSAVWACAARRQASGVVLGRIQPVPMSRHVAALQKALRDRDQWAEKKAERYEAECPKFDSSQLLAGLDRIRLRTEKQRSDAGVLRELIASEPRSVNFAITHTRGTYRVGLKALRSVGDVDSEISWIVGHYQCGVTSRVELGVHGVYAAIRKFAWRLAFLLACVACVCFAFRRQLAAAPAAVSETVRKASQAVAHPSAPAAPAPAPGQQGQAVAFACVTGMATFAFGLQGAVVSAALTLFSVLLTSIEPR